MALLEIISLIVIALPIAVFIFFWSRNDLKNKSNYIVIDPKTGKVVSIFRDWLEGKEENDNGK